MNPESASTLGELLDAAAARWGDRPSVGFEGAWETFAETRERSDRLARALMALGVGPGEHVSLWMTNRPEWIHAMFALAKIGAAMVPLNTRFRSEDLEYVLRQSDSVALLTMERSGPIRYLDIACEAIPELAHHDRETLGAHGYPALRRVVSLGREAAAADPDAPARPGVFGWEELLALADRVSPEALAERARAVRPEDPLYIMYTSGTTGFPKGAIQSHAILRNGRTTAARIGMTEADATIMFLPLFHAFGYFEGALLTFVTGARMVLTETFDAGESLEAIERERGTLIHGFDTHFQDLMDHPDFHRRDWRSLRTGILAAGLPSTEKVVERCFREFVPTITGWGMTETLPGTLLGRLGDDLERSKASGEPQDGYTVEIVDAESGEPRPDGTPGEIRVSGYGVMQGYYKKPAETAATFDERGRLKTGDMGVRLANGSFKMLGRYKEMLKVGGENVDPAEVEAYYLEHPAVNRIQVVGVPDERMGEIPIGFVQLAPGMIADESELLAHGRGRIASFKLPRHFFFVDEYPMTSSGKVKRFELRAFARRELCINLPDVEVSSGT